MRERKKRYNQDYYGLRVLLFVRWCRINFILYLNVASANACNFAYYAKSAREKKK